jgi:hypothetical protein
MAVMPAVESPLEPWEEPLPPWSAAGDELSAAPVRVVPPTTGVVLVTTTTVGEVLPLSDVCIVVTCVM